MKIDVIYRCCGNEMTPETIRTVRPKWFDKRMCFKSVWDMSISDPSTFSIHVIYDGPNSTLMDYIKHFRVSDGAIYFTNSAKEDNKYASIGFQWDLADTLTGDWIYFVEDDYLHTKDAARVMMEGANKFTLLSLYDHLDRYTRYDDVTIGRERVKLSPSCHWRTAESTCSTWACSRITWREIRELAKERGPNDRHFFQDLVKRDIRLWTPMPARSTHCYKGYMSPLVDWDKIAAGVCL